VAASSKSAPSAARARACFPDVDAGTGHYESFYLKAAHPSEPLAVWIRYTVHKSPGAVPHGSLWFTLFDGAAEGPTASKITLEPEELAAGAGDYIRVGDSHFGPASVAGRADSERGDAAWELAFESGEAPYRHLPRDWMYGAPVPRTKLESPHPAARFTGWVEAGGRRIELDGWPGMVGHNWGEQHAERWIWMHGAGFDGHGDDTWLDAALGRIKLGPVTAPWIGNASLALDGSYHRLGGIERVLSTEVGETPRGCDFVLPAKDVTVFGSVLAEPKDRVGWVYADPDGSEHHTVNCSIARMRLTVRRRGAADVLLESPSGATYELGMRERDHGVAIQPFPDG